MLNSKDSQFLIDYAVKNIWANSRLENNYIYKPKKITTDLPRINYWECQGLSLSLPDTTSRWHLYWLGALSDAHLGITTSNFVGWTSIDSLMVVDNYLVSIYQEDGLVYPNSLCYLTRQPNGVVVLAINADNYPHMLLGEEDIYFQIYRNKISNIEIVSQYIERESDRVSFLNALQASQLKKGFTTINKNGYFTKDLIAANLAIGDYVEFTYDSSVLYVNEFTLLDLESFESDNDKARYYVVMNGDLHHSNDEFLLRYRNDVHFYVTSRDGDSGRYLHRNNTSSIYQLTHQDLAIKVSDVDFYLNQLSGENNATAKLITVIRDDGQSQRWEGDASRIYELYQLDADSIEANLLGKVASVTEWSANHLIKCEYNTMLKSDYSALTGDDLYKSLGYYAVNTILNKNYYSGSELSKINVINLTPTQQVSSTKIEYHNGLIVGFTPMTNIKKIGYGPQVNGVEIYGGSAEDVSVDDFDRYNIPTLTLQDNRWYRFYKRSNLIGSTWVDVTDVGDGTDYEIVNGEFRWLLDLTTHEVIIRDSYYTPLVCGDNLNTVTDFNVVTIPYHIPSAEIIAFGANGHSLVEGIDYLVSWPHVAFVGKKLFNSSSVSSSLRLILRGFPDDPNKHQKTNKEVGFVQYGSISYNRHYDLKDWRNSRISVGSKVFGVDALEFGEDLTVASSRFVNGEPYEWLTPTTTLAAYSDRQFSELEKKKDDELDTRVSNYLTKNKPQKEFNTPSTYPNHYILFSTFINAIIKEFDSGHLSFTYNDISIHSLDVLLKDYLYLLPLDPCVNDSDIDWDIVIVEPHQDLTPKTVSPDLYRILDSINNYYLKNRVSLVRLLHVS